MKRFFILATLLISIYAFKAHAQTNTVCGYILNEDLKPIPHAIIEVVGSLTMVESKSDGYYSIIVPIERQKVKVYAIGYKPLVIEINKISLLDVILVSNDVKKKHSECVTIPWNMQNKANISLLTSLAYKHYEDYRYEDALALWHEGEKLGCASCIYYIGIMNLNGYGIPINKQKAYNYIRISALKGFDVAQLALGDIYCNGSLSHCDTTMAVYWYGKSASQGNSQAKQKLDSLSAYKRVSQGGRKKCIALILGNFKYWKGNVLPVVKNDVEALAEQLKALGIETKLYKNLNKPEMLDSIDAFTKAAQGYDLALFYYAGLSAQSKGSNFLIPVGKMRQKSENGILADCVNVDYLFDWLSDNGIDSKIVILDACRDNSSVFGTKGDGSHQGLSSSSLNPYGSFVAYATQPNATTEETAGKVNSPFLLALVMALKIPNLQIYEMFELVKMIVTYETDGKQVPAYMNNLKDKIVLNTNSQ